MSGAIVFTGKGIDPRTNKLRVRGAWENLGKAKGFYAQKKVNRSTNFLVASRNDTVKAADASSLGVKVISYNDFAAMCRGAVVDTTRFDSTPPPQPIDTSELEEIEGWGMF